MTWNIDQLATYFQASTRTVCRCLQRGIMPSEIVGGRRVVKHDDLLAFLGRSSSSPSKGDRTERNWPILEK